MNESNVLKLVMLELSRLGSTMFRQNVGQAWGGKIIPLAGGAIKIENARPITMGLTKGSSDLIGWTPVEITQDMVGTRVAVFTAIEGKRSKGGVTTPEQKQFNKRVREAGGIAGVAASPEAAVDIIGRWSPSPLG